jgi:tetratricopeptide (TPR) repeat protein
MPRSGVARAAVAAAALLVFLPVVGHEFVNLDDDVNVYANPRLDPVTRESFAGFWRTASFHVYMPVTQTAWAAIALGARRAAEPEPARRFDPRPFHAANVVVHAGSAALVATILACLGLGAGPAAAGALFFALHPLQVEPVAWVTGLKDVLGGGLGLAAIWQYLLFAGAGAGRHPRLHWALATLAFVLGMLSKPTLLGLPLVVAILARGVLGRPWRDVLRSLWPWVGLSGLCMLVNGFVQPAPRTIVPLAARAWVALDSLGFYLERIVVPMGLAIDHGRTPAAVLASPWGRLAPWLALAAGAALVLGRTRALPWRVPAAVLAAGLLPVLGLVPFGYQDVSTVADRYAYLALLGPALAFGRLASRAGRWPARAALAVVLVALAAVSLRAQRHWKTPQALFEHALEVNPRSRIARFDLGVALAQAGRHAEAARHFGVLLEANPQDDEAESALGRAFAAAGRMDDAVLHYRRAVRLRPENLAARFDLAAALVAQQRLDEAAREYEAVLALRPGDALGHFNLANVLAAQGQLEAALGHYEAAVQSDPALEAARRKRSQVLQLLRGAGEP